MPQDSMAKYRLYSDFCDMTELDITTLKQTKEFFDADGRNALDIYSEKLKLYTIWGIFRVFILQDFIQR